MLTIVAEPDASGGFTTSVVEMPGCHSEGDTLEDALRNTADAIRGWAAVKAAEIVDEAMSRVLQQLGL